MENGNLSVRWHREWVKVIDYKGSIENYNWDAVYMVSCTTTNMYTTNLINITATVITIILGITVITNVS